MIVKIGGVALAPRMIAQPPRTPFLCLPSNRVMQVAFHPTESIIGSCGSDKNIYLGEIGA